MGQWEVFLSPYRQAVDELKIKLKGMRSQFGIMSANSPIEFVTGRVKPLASIYDKSFDKGIPFEPNPRLGNELQDIAGVRIMCQFVDDIATVTELIRQRNDMKVIEEKAASGWTNQDGIQGTGDRTSCIDDARGIR